MLSDAELKRIAHQAEIQTFSTESLRRFERAILSYVEQRIRAEEREACAKVCEELRDEDGYEAWNTECAAAIRSRTQEKQGS